MSKSETYDLNAYQTTEEPKEVLTADRIEEMENFVVRTMREGTLEKDKREASSLGQGGYGKVAEHSGIYSYSIPVHVPTPQNGGPVPTVSIVYNSRGSDSPSLIAAGWRLELGRIERVPEEGGYMDFENDQGQPGANTHFVLQLNGRSYTLVKVQGKDHVFRSKIENSFIEAERFLHKDKLDPDSGKPVIDYWEARSGDGKLFRFGVEGDEGDVPGEVENKIWNIVSIEDAYGQRVEYEYEHYIKPGSPHTGHEKSYSYPSCVKVGMTKEGDFWDTEVRFIYREDDALDPNEGYYFLDTEYTGREESGIVAVIWKRLIAVETYYKDEDGNMTLSRRLEVEASLHEGREKFWVDRLNEVAFKKGDPDHSTDRPPYKFEYKWEDNENLAMMYKSTAPLGNIAEIEYDLAENVDEEAFGVDGIYLVTSFTERAGKEAWTKSYKYLGGKLYTPFGEYRGHKKVVVHDEETKHTTETHYTQTGVHNGYILKQYQRDANNNLISTLENTWMALNYYGGRYMPFTSESIQRNYSEDGKTVLSTVFTPIPKSSVRENPWEYAVDKYGNVLVQIETTYEGDMDSGAVVLQKKTETIYKNIDEGKYCIIGLHLVNKEFARSSQPQEWQLTDWIENTYNDKGQSIENVSHYDLDDPDKVYKKVTEYHPQCGKTSKTYRYDGSKKLLVAETAFYEDGPYRFLRAQIINVKGQVEETLKYDLQFRSPSHGMQTNGMIVNTAYDGLGRTIEERFIGHKEVSVKDKGSNSVRYVYTITPEKRSIETIHIHTDARTKEYFDPLKRKFKVLDTGYKGRGVIKEHTEFDLSTRKPARMSEPYYIDESSPGYRTIEYNDPRLRKTKEIYPNGKIVRVVYDGLRQTTLEEIFDYDDNGNVSELLHTRVVEEVTTNCIGHTVKRAEGQADQQKRYEIYYTYDLSDRLIEVSDSLGVKLQTMTYGSRLDDKAVATEDINLGKTAAEYDGLGRIKEEKRDFKASLDLISIFTYDDLDRVIEQTEQDTINKSSRVIRSEFDTAPHGTGLLAKQELTDISSLGQYVKREQYSYDDFGLPSSTIQEWNVQWSEIGDEQTLKTKTDYVHNGLKGGRLESVIYPIVDGLSGGTSEYIYEDLSGMMVEIIFNGKSIWKVGDAGFTARDQIKEIILGNGIKSLYDYNTKTGWMSEAILKRGPTTLMEGHLIYDTAANIKNHTVKSVTLDESGKEKQIASEASYTYDGKNQLITALEDGKQQTFSYKTNGSRIQFLEDDIKTLYTYDLNSPHQMSRLTGGHERILTYDQAGNLISDLNEKNRLTRQLTWNPSNKLQNVDFLDPEQQMIRRLSYGYGPDDERIMKYDSMNDSLIFYVDDGFEVAWSKKEDNKLIYTHIFDEKRRVATFEQDAGKTGEMCYYHRDHLYSVTLMTDDQGGVLSAINYEPFGSVKKESGTPKTDLLYNGQRADIVNYEGFSHYDYVARMYEPELGIFMSPDEVEDTEGVAFGHNRYIYASNNPLSVYDPTGTQGKPAAWLPPANDVKTVLNKIQGRLYQKILKLKQSKYYKTTRGRLLVDKMNSLIHNSKGETVWEIDVRAPRGIKTIGLKGGKVNIITPVGSPWGGAWTGGKTYVRLGFHGPWSRQSEKYTSGKTTGYADINRVITTLANESVHALNKETQYKREWKWDFHLEMGFVPTFYSTRYGVSAQEENDSDRAEKEVRDALGIPQRYYNTYANMIQNPDYVPIGDPGEVVPDDKPRVREKTWRDYVGGATEKTSLGQTLYK
jgi:RHS repeat-associated protein